MDRLKDDLRSHLKRPDCSIYENDIEQLKSSNYDIIIWGCGGLSRKITAYLEEHGVTVSAYAEGKEFWTEGKTFFEKQVYSLENLDKYVDACNLIIGTAGDSKSKMYLDILQNMMEVKGIYSFENMALLCDISYEWVEKNIESLQEVYDALADESSKEIFKSYLHTMSGGCFQDVSLKPWQYLDERQYFNSLYNSCHFSSHVLVDCGAFIGDTAEKFISYIQDTDKGKRCRVYAFEPNQDSFRELQKVSEKFEKQIVCFPYGVSDQEETLSFALNDSASHITEQDTGIMIELKRADDVLKDVSDISIVKMDLEGAEVSALKGMENLITEQMPFLAICVYHKTDDLLEIPHLIKSYEEHQKEKYYEYYLRIHSTITHELVYYAVPKSVPQ